MKATQWVRWTIDWRGKECELAERIAKAVPARGLSKTIKQQMLEWLESLPKK